MKEVKDILFSPLYPDDRLNPNYLSIVNEELPFARELIKRWADGFKDRDNKFVKEFQTTFNSSFWELYLFATLKEIGLEVNMEYDRPDFVVEGDKGFVIEATIASHAQNETPEWQKDYSEKDIKEWPLEKIIENATLRLANSFIGKSRKYKISYNELPHVKNKPYVIAIAPFDSPYFFMQNQQPIQRVLFGFDRYIAIDWDDEKRDILDAIYMENIEKKTGSKVPLGYFTSPEHSHVSAVIFSNVATFSKVRVMSDDPRITIINFRRFNDFGTQALTGVVEKSIYEEHLLDGLIVFHNPFAEVPFEIEEFLHEKIAHATINIGTKEFLPDMPDGFLFQRNIKVFNINASPEKIEWIKSQLIDESTYFNTSFPRIHE